MSAEHPGAPRNALAQRAISLVVVVLGLVLAFQLGRCEVGEGAGAAPAPPAQEPTSMPTSMPSTSHDHAAAAPTEFVCPMHPQIRQDHEGTCPICHMDLVPVTSSSGADSDVALTLGDAAVALAQVRVAEVAREPLERSLRVFGRVATADSAQAQITAWAAGRIERLYVDTVGQQVSRGDRLARVYSPELVIAQQTLVHGLDALDAAESAGSDVRARAARASIDAARAELRLLGMAARDIDDVASTRRVSETVTLRAPASGTVMERFVREGDHVAVGTPLVALADLDTVWVELEVYERDLPQVHPGQPVAVRWPGHEGTVNGEVDYVDVVVDPARRVARVRVVVPNDDGALRPEQYVEAELDLADGGRPPITVPRTAVLWTGTRSLVYVYDTSVDPPVYMPVEVELGESVGDRVVVEDGVWPGELVVVHGAMRVDAELQIRGGASMMQGRSPLDEGAP